MRRGKREIVFILQQFAVTNNACNRLTTVCIDCTEQPDTSLVSSNDLRAASPTNSVNYFKLVDGYVVTLCVMTKEFASRQKKKKKRRERENGRGEAGSSGGTDD